MSTVCAKDDFGEGGFQKFSNLVNAQNTYAGVFLSLATSQVKQTFEQKMSDPLVKEVERIRSIAFNGNRKIKLTNELRSAMGYGGMLHVFKNYVLRGQQKYLDVFNQRVQAIDNVLARYLKLPGLSDAAKRDIGTVRDTTSAYQQGMKTAVEMKKNGQTVAAIDGTVKINDGPALRAIENLGKGGFGVDPVHWFKTITGKINLLK